MALIQVSYELIENNEFFDILVDSFDGIKEVLDEPFYKRKVFRVVHPEVPNDDVVICPSFVMFEGVRPFIIEYDA
jgi:hypothetical protein